MGTNCTGPFLLTELLTPLLKKTAASSPAGSVRVTWAASLGTMGSPKGGVAWDETTGAPKVHGVQGVNYAQTKAGNVLLAREYAARHAGDGIVSNAWNPGNLSSELQRHSPWWQRVLFQWVLHPSVYGGYTELFAGWSEEAGQREKQGAYIGPWGRFVMLRKDVDESSQGKRLWEWCEQETKAFAA